MGNNNSSSNHHHSHHHHQPQPYDPSDPSPNNPKTHHQHHQKPANRSNATANANHHLHSTAAASLSSFSHQLSQRPPPPAPLLPNTSSSSSSSSSSQSQPNPNHTTHRFRSSKLLSSIQHHSNRTNPNNPTQATLKSTHSSAAIDQVAVRKRKSLELPDLDPYSTDQPLSAHSISNQNHPHLLAFTPSNIDPNNPIAPSGLTHFELKLSDSAHNPSRPSTPSNSNHHIILPSAISPQSALAAIRSDLTHHPSASIPPPPSNPTVNPGQPPQDPNSSDDPSLTQYNPSDSSHPDPQHSTQPPSRTCITNSPVNSTAPLQQPIETVVPPLPPPILQPFPSPLPSLDADSAEIPQGVSAALTNAVTETVAAATAVVQAAPALDIGAGSEGVPTLLTWKEPASEVYVTGTFSKWKQQIKLRKPITQNQSDQQQEAFSALVALPPGPHQLKFIVDRRWKTSKYLPSATDDKGNLINYLQVNPGDQPFRGLGPRGIWSGYTYGDWSIGSSILEEGGGDQHTDSEDEWTTEIPSALLDYEDYHDREAEEAEEFEADHEAGGGDHSQQHDHHPTNHSTAAEELTPGQAGFAAEPPKLPAQLKEGILNLSSRLPEGSSDDNSLLPRPDHSVLNHLAASPIRQGLLSVGVTSRFKRKYLTTVYYKPVDL